MPTAPGRSAWTRPCTSTAASTRSRAERTARARCSPRWRAAPTLSSRACACSAPASSGVEEAVTLVTFRSLDDRAIDAYVAAGEWEGRAGGYAIQGLGARLVERIDGDYLNVVGLPAALVVGLLETHVPALLAR